MSLKLRLGLGVLIGGWLLLLLTGLFWLGQKKLAQFDPNGALIRATLSPDYEQALVAQLDARLKQTVVHFSQPSCYCHWVARPHVASVRQLAKESGYQNHSVTLTSEMAWSSLIPSVPAVAVFDDKGELSYLGPYSTGFYCSAGKGLVEAFIQKQPTEQVGAFIASEAQGCYCPLKAERV